MARKYKISEVAELLGVSASAIRFYEKKGLFKAEKDQHNGYRTFDEKDIKKIWSIAYHRNIDMSLATISHLKHTENLTEIKNIVAEQRAKALAKIAEEQKKVKILNFYLETLDSVARNLGKFSLIDTSILHLFGSEYFYKPGTDICTLGFPIALFGEGESFREYIAVHHEFINLLSPEDAGTAIAEVPSFRALYTIAQQEGNFDEAKVLASVLSKARELHYKVEPPYYVLYLISAGEWAHTNRFYEVFLPLAD